MRIIPNQTVLVQTLGSEQTIGPEAHNELPKGAAGIEKDRGTKHEVTLRPSLPRGTKSAHKTVSIHPTQFARVNPKHQSKKAPNKHH